MNFELELKDILIAIRKKIKIVVSFVFLFSLGGSLAGFFTPPIFEAKSDLLVNSLPNGNVESTLVASEIDTNLRLIETYKQIMKSDRMKNKVNKKLNGIYSNNELAKKIKIESSEQSQIITIVANEQTPEKAVLLVNTYVTTFQDEIRMLMNLNNITILKEEVEVSDTKKIKYSPLLYSILAFVTSVLLSLITIIVKEVYFTSLDSERKAEKVLQIPIVGTITAKRNDKLLSNELSTNLHADVQNDQQFKELALNIHHNSKRNKIKKIMVTSSHSREGKTFIAGKLAITLASDFKKVVYVDADFRKSDGRKFFNVLNRNGWISYISGQNALSEIIHPTQFDHLSFIGTGPLPQNPTPFLISEKMAELLWKLEAMFDIVIVDTPALTEMDMIHLLPIVDGCLFIVNTKKTKGKQALDGIKILKKFDGQIIGAILNSRKRKSNKS